MKDSTPTSPRDSARYFGIAYRKAVYDELLSVLETYAPDAPTPLPIMCDDVPYNSRAVPASVVKKVMKELKTVIEEADTELAEYGIRKLPKKKIVVRRKSDGRQAPRATARHTTARKKSGNARKGTRS